VSYVLNRTPGQSIPEATQRRVLDAAARIGYEPNVHAQALAGGRSRIVVIDISDLPAGDLLTTTARTLAEAVSDLGYVPVVDQLSRGGNHTLLLALCSGVVPALVVTVVPLPDEILSNLRTAGVTDVVSLFPSREVFFDGVAELARVQGEYLIAQGHTRVLAVRPALEHLEQLSAARLAVLRDTFVPTGVVLDVITDSESNSASASASASAGLAHDLLDAVTRGCTAVAAYNDEVAIAVLGAAARAGIAVPQQLAVVGIDDLPLASRVHPALTTVRAGSLDPALATQLVATLLRGETPTGDIPTPVLVRRASA
jgi:DNA-binding LacI/PurR family transcriptional regulator